MRARSIVTVVVASAMFAACSYDWTFTPDGGPGPADGASEGFAADAVGDGTPLQPGECNPTTRCAPGLFCDYANDDCGRSAPGKCVDPKAIQCDDAGLSSVCQCNGTKAVTTCMAHLNGFDTDKPQTVCEPTFECSGTKCNRGKQYCAMRPPSSTMCVDFATACTPSCDCPELKTLIAMGCSCNDDGAGGVSVKCP